MNRYQIFKALFFVLDAEYDECNDENLGDYLSGMNPFLFKDEGSADPALYNDFSSIFKSEYGSFEKELEYDEAYDFAKLFLERVNNINALKFFVKTSKSKWVDILYNSEV